MKVNAIGRAVQEEVHRHGFGVVRGLCGHGVGRTIHEEPQVPNDFDRLSAGCVDGRSRPDDRADDQRRLSRSVREADGWTIRTADGSLAAHCEHTLVITTGAPLVLAA